MAADALNLEAMEERELLALLARLYGEFLERLSTHEDVGEGDPDGERTGEITPPVPEALEAGVVLASRLETLNRAFLYGGDDELIPTREGDTWLAGLVRFRRGHYNKASRPEALAR